MFTREPPDLSINIPETLELYVRNHTESIKFAIYIVSEIASLQTNNRLWQKIFETQ